MTCSKLSIYFSRNVRSRSRLELHASKCVLFATMVRYCGRLTTKEGVVENASLLTGVTSTADELTSFVYSALLLGCGVSVAEDNRGI
jgi:hypothetical protein